MMLTQGCSSLDYVPMAFTLEHVQQVRNGHPRQIGVLSDSVWKYLKWVYLGSMGLSISQSDMRMSRTSIFCGYLWLSSPDWLFM